MSGGSSRLRRLFGEARSLWDESALLSQAPLSRLHKLVHFWVLVWKSFTRNRCPIRASALAYASLLALVPMLAVVLSVSSSLLKKQGEEPIYQFVEKLVNSVTPKTGLAITDSVTTPDAAAGQPANEQAVKAR